MGGNNLSPTAAIFLNVKNSDWWGGDITDPGGREIHILATQHGLRQIIDGPIHLLENSSSCFDLIFS